jgi:hypothetical protein
MTEKRAGDTARVPGEKTDGSGLELEKETIQDLDVSPEEAGNVAGGAQDAMLDCGATAGRIAS